MSRLKTYFSRLFRLAGFMAAFAFLLAAAVVVVTPQLSRIVSAHVSDHEQINLDKLQERSIMYDRNGNQMAVLQRENRIPVKLADISPHVVDAVLSVEDADFYQHKGVNLRSIVRALYSNVDAGGVAQGGSTITQQVVKNSVVGNERTLSRKLKEAALAIELEKQMTKPQILERYLNTAYFGHNAYGVQAAAQTYFNKNAKELDWAQSALLASLISNPSQYDPIAHPDRSFKQRRLALDRIAENHKLPKAAADFSNFAPLPTTITEPPPPEGYFTQDVINRLLDDTRLGSNATARYNAVFRGGLRIYTTYDPAAQKLAEQARNTTMPSDSNDGTFSVTDPNTGKAYTGTAAMVSVEPGTGAVRMMVGGVDPSAPDGYNLADPYGANQPGRQAGSSFKPFILAEGLEKGAVPDDTVDGTGPCPGLPGYDPSAVPGNFAGEPGFVGTLTQQTQQSSNCAFLRLGQIFGIHDSIALAKKLGVTSTKLPDEVTSAALGTNNVTPLDMASAYSVFANGGVRNPPYFVERVEDSSGNILFKHEATPERVMSTQSARLITQVLKANVDAGTGTAAIFPSGQPAAGKTGTTEQAADLWFVGYTPQMATAVWMGATGGAIPLSFGGGDATGGVYAARTWAAYMFPLLDGSPIVQFDAPGATRGGRYLAMGQDNGLTAAPANPADDPAPPPATTIPTDPNNPAATTNPLDPSQTTAVDPNQPPATTVDPVPPTAPPGLSPDGGN